MRISYRIATVGGIPVAIAALIAGFAGILLQHAERSREAAVLAGAAYREMIAATAGRNDFIRFPADNRHGAAIQFRRSADGAQAILAQLEPLAGGGEQATAVATARQAAARHTERMGELVRATRDSDNRLRGMAEQAAALLALTEQARKRQHASNNALVASLAEADRRLRTSRAVVDHLHDLRELLPRAQLAFEAAKDTPGAGGGLPLLLDRIARVLPSLGQALTQASGMEGHVLSLPSGDVYATALAELQRLRGQPLDRATLPLLAPRFDAMAERVLKVAESGYNALQDEVAELLRFSVAANDMEQETQNIAVAALRLSARASEALADRDPATLRAVAVDGTVLTRRIAALTISPLIQDDMLAAINSWREGLERATEGLERQNAAINAMDADAAAVMDTTRRLNDLFTMTAERSGSQLRSLLMIGATTGLLLAVGAALLVARGISRPLRRLRRTTLRLAQDPRDGRVADLHRGDELGDLARAVHHFVAEINRREDDLRRAKEQADATLAELRRTQAHLVQAEKMALLGQVVAGVAHEINTPLGITLTTSTLIREKVPKIMALLEAGQLRRRDLERFLRDMDDVSELLVNNTLRAAELVQRFKQVALDPAGEARTRFGLGAGLAQAVVALEPSWKPAGHSVILDCAPGLEMDGYPGAIALIVTHLLSNAITHGFAPGEAGIIVIGASRSGSGEIELIFADNGGGIPEEVRGRVFDPFFTTRRDLGHSGLGLHIVYNTVNQLNGTITLDGTAGRGARFIVRLPAASP